MFPRSVENRQRIKLTQINPNPLFEKWLMDWIKQAEDSNSMKKHALAKALDSLRKYPLMLRTGRDCSILDGFGVGICKMLDEKLKKVENLMSEQRHDESLKQAVNKAAERINQVNYGSLLFLRCFHAMNKILTFIKNYCFSFYSGETTSNQETHDKANESNSTRKSYRTGISNATHKYCVHEWWFI